MDLAQLLVKYLSVAGGAALKFVFGPVAGVTMGLSWPETALLTALGAMTTVTVIAYGGAPVRYWFARRFGNKLFSKKTRRSVRLWRAYGIYGVSFMMPLILMPAGGAILAVSFGERPYRIVFWMAISSLFWGFVFAVSFHALGESFVKQYWG